LTEGQLPQQGPGLQGPQKFGFWSILGPQKSRQNRQLAFESGAATSESGRQVPPCPNVEPPLGKRQEMREGDTVADRGKQRQREER